MKTAIRDCSDSLRSLLEQELMDDVDLSPYFDPFDPTPDALGTMIVTLDNPEELAEREHEGVSVWLYLVERDGETLNEPPRRIAPDRMLRRPLPLRLHYLVTPQVDHTTREHAAELEQLILGKVFQVFHDATCLRGARLVNSLAGQPLEFFIRLEPLTLEQITRVWHSLQRSYQLCVSYEVSIVPIDSAEEASIRAPVDVVLPEYGVAAVEGSPP
ncbi:MAG: DUF4255 domain-containing protein [Burkholderiales bacterium]